MSMQQNQIGTETETGGSHTIFENIVINNKASNDITNTDDHDSLTTPQSNQEKEDGYG